MSPDLNLETLFKEPRALPPTERTHAWELIGGSSRNGSWSDEDRQNRVRALAEFQGALFAGIGAADAEVWKFDGARWSQVGGAGIMGSWEGRRYSEGESRQTAEMNLWADALLADAGDKSLYAGVRQDREGSQLWRFDGGSWKQVGGLGNRGDWRSTDYDSVYTLVWHEERLHVGLMGILPPPGAVSGYRTEYRNGEIYRFDGSRWERIAGQGHDGSWDASHSVTWVYKLLSFDGDLYAAIARHGVRNRRWTGEVWRLREGHWERLGGDGVRGSWNLATNNVVTSMIAYQGKLLIGYNCQARQQDTDRFGNVWAWDPAIERWYDLAFTTEGEDRSPAREQRSFNALAVFQGHLVVGGGRADIPGNLALWRLSLSDQKWKSLGRPKMQEFSSAEEAAIWERNEYVYSMALYREDLAVGFRGPDGTADAWRLRKRE